MTRTEMIDRLIKGFNRTKSTKYRVSNEETRAIVNEALDAGTEEAFWNREIYNYVTEYAGDSIQEAFRAYIRSKETPEEAPKKDEVIPSEVIEAPKTESPKTETPEANQINGYMGLLEKALAEVIVNTQGERIASEIVGNLGDKVDEYIRQNYGTVKRKVELEVEDRKVEFEEKLHNKFETVLKFVKMNEPVFLTGAAGTGKNVLCKQVAKAMGLDFYFTNAVTQEYKLTGFTDAVGEYHETEFYKAFKNGGLFMLDEMDASIPEVLVILNAAIANRYFDFPAPIGCVEAHPDFRVIAVGNTFGLGADYDYVGRNQLDAASLDRFALVRIDYDKEIELSVCENDKELVEFCDNFRETANKVGVRTIVSYRAIGRIAKMAKLMDLNEVLTTCLLKNLQKDDMNMILKEMRVSETNRYYKTFKEITEVR